MTHIVKTINDIEQGELLKIINNFKSDLIMLLSKYKEKNALLEMQIKMCLRMSEIMENYTYGTTYIKFTPKDLEILELLLLNLTDEAILNQLHITQYTLNTHYQHIARKIYDNDIHKFYTLKECNYLKSPKTAIRKYLTNSIVQIMFRGIDADSKEFSILKNTMPDIFS